jgi:hypothetical protein
MDEEQQNAATAAAVTAARKTRRLKMISVLEREEQFPLQTRNEMDELIQDFLEKVEKNIYDMLCDHNVVADDYRGLDSDRNTEAEVETVIRFFPSVLSRINDGSYPIQRLSYTCDYDDSDLTLYGFNMNAASFIHLLAELAIELGMFDAHFRGGLLCEDVAGENVLVELMRRNTIKSQIREQRELVDKKCVQVLIQLRKLGLFKKEDIQRYGLLHMGCCCHHSEYIAENSFRFLIEWDPNALLDSGHKYWGGGLPLHVAVERSCFQGFQLVFDAGIRYFPKKKGISLLFEKNDNGDTPFQMACKKFGSGVVMAGVEETLTRYNSCSDNTSPLNIMEAFKAAVIDESVHIDCLYFLMQREPCVLQKLLSLKPEAMLESGMDSTNSIIGNKNSNSSSDDENDKTGKRKRKENTEQNDKN